ncbi:PIN domain-like protein [Scleroderma citrinum]
MSFFTLCHLALAGPPCAMVMGLNELWEVLAPVAMPCMLTEVAIEGFKPLGSHEANGQLLTVGCNASAWTYSLCTPFSWCQAGTGRSPEMKTIFCCLAVISRVPLHPHFIFNGPDHPSFKGDRGPISAPPLLEQCFQELLAAFGFNWHVAPGEAEAELAYFHSHGLIDIVASLFNNALLFGATSVMQSIPSSDRYSSKYEDVEVYTSDAMEHDLLLQWGDLLLIVLMTGTDYDSGLPGCTVDITRRVALYGLGRTLLQVVSTEPFVEVMNFLTKHFELACLIEEDCMEFPNPAVLAAYLLPLMSWSDGHQPPVAIIMSHQPDLAALTAFCLDCLDWSMDMLQPILMDVYTGTVICALLQLPGKVDSWALWHSLQVAEYHDQPQPIYKVSVPSQLFPAMSIGTESLPDVSMSLPSGDTNGHGSYDVDVLLIVLECTRPDLVQGPNLLTSQSIGMESICEGLGSGLSDMVINLTVDTLCLEAGFINLMRDLD